ncbi:MAG: hypothetical protein ACK5S3_08645, partial [Pirellulaceae bacterium]
MRKVQPLPGNPPVPENRLNNHCLNKLPRIPLAPPLRPLRNKDKVNRDKVNRGKVNRGKVNRGKVNRGKVNRGKVNRGKVNRDKVSKD